jgi:hypothetical protein
MLTTLPTMNGNTIPSQLEDGTVNSVVARAAYSLGAITLVDLAIPAGLFQGEAFGRFVMARCSHEGCSGNGWLRTDWSIYLRRPLYVAATRPIFERSDEIVISVSLPAIVDPGYDLLRRLRQGDSVNLLGPYGRRVHLSDHARHLLLAASVDRAPLALSAAESMLDRGGRVTLVVRDAARESQSALNSGLLSLFPIAVEIQATASHEQWTESILESVAWADALFILDPVLSPQGWADLVRRRRIVLDDGFAFILMASNLLCCTGACMCCVVPRTNGSLTRACVHGPVFPLTELID